MLTSASKLTIILASPYSQPCERRGYKIKCYRYFSVEYAPCICPARFAEFTPSISWETLNMKQIDEARLESDLGYRFEYLAEFAGFGAEDIEVIHGAAAVIAPLVPTLVDAVYDRLVQQDATWRHFMPRQHNYDGDIPTNIEDLTMDHPQIAFRKQHLARYLEALVTRPYDAKMVMYLDMVGKIHTRKAGNAEIFIPAVQMTALMCFVSNAFVQTIIGLDVPQETKNAALISFNKLLWLQNDLLMRHYCAE